MDEAEDISSQQRIEAMPTFQFFINGVKVDEFVGANKESLEAMIVKNLK